MLTRGSSSPTSPGGSLTQQWCNIIEWIVRWLHSWHMIGLDSAEEAFDIILMTHPVSVKKLPTVRVIDNQGFLWYETFRSASKYQWTLTHSQQDLAVAFGGSSGLYQVQLSGCGSFHRLLREGSQVRLLSQQPRVSLPPSCKFSSQVQVS